MHNDVERTYPSGKKYKVLNVASLKSLFRRITIVETDKTDEIAMLDARYAKILARLGVMRSICERACSMSMSDAERARYQGDIESLAADIDALASEVNDGGTNAAKNPDYDNLTLSLSNRMNVIENGDGPPGDLPLNRKKRVAIEEKMKSWMNYLFDS